MVENSSFDIVLWSNILAGSALIFYGYFMWLQARGIIRPSERAIYLVRFSVLFLLLTPLAARYQYSEAVIMYLSVMIASVGLIIKIINKKGL